MDHGNGHKKTLSDVMLQDLPPMEDDVSCSGNSYRTLLTGSRLSWNHTDISAPCPQRVSETKLLMLLTSGSRSLPREQTPSRPLLRAFTAHHLCKLSTFLNNLSLLTFPGLMISRTTLSCDVASLQLMLSLARLKLLTPPHSSTSSL